MRVVRLTNEDLDKMVRQVVHSLLNESINETQGVIMADNEEVIDKIVDFIQKEWVRKQKVGPDSVQTYKNKQDGHLVSIESYLIQVSTDICDELGISDDFEMLVHVENYLLNSQDMAKFSRGDRSSRGATHFGGIYNMFSRSHMKFKHSSIELIVPAVNYELQLRGLYNVLYHELNHLETGRLVKANHQHLSDYDLSNLDIATASRRSKYGTRLPHFTVQDSLNPDPLSDLMADVMYGSYRDQFDRLNNVFYALWEQTERNARAEGIYGDLKYLKPTRENFSEVFKETELCYEIEILHKYVNGLEKVPTDTREGMGIWNYAASVMNMQELPTRQKGRDFFEEVRSRFVKRSRELIDEMYRKAMKIAELYFTRMEAREKAGRAPSIHDKINTRAQAKTGKL